MSHEETWGRTPRWRPNDPRTLLRKDMERLTAPQYRDPTGSGRTSRLTWGQVRQIRALAARGHARKLIAAAFGVTPMTVHGIVRGDAWQERQ